MDDVFSCGETAWDLVHDRSYFLLRKKYTPSLKGNPASICYLLFFICGLSSIACWFGIISYLLLYKVETNIHFLYYYSAYSLGSLPVLAIHKNYEHTMSKKDFPRSSFLIRMCLLAAYGIVISVLFSVYSFSLLFTLLCILGLGVCHGSLLGGLSQFASVFPSPCYGYLILGVDLAGVLPFFLVILDTIFPSSALLHVLLSIPAFVSFVGIVASILLLRSDMANQYLGQSGTILRNNIEGLESLLSRSGDDHEESINAGQYVSLSSFVSVYPTDYRAALAWGVLVFLCTFCTYFMVPFFPEAEKTSRYFPAFLFFVQHFSDITGRELLCKFVKHAVKGKPMMWVLAILRALIITGWLAEVLTCPIGGWGIGTLEIGALILCGLVGGSVNPATYMLAGLRISDDTRDSVKAMYVCMWCSVAGAVTALSVLNLAALLSPHAPSLSWGGLQ